MGLGNLEKYGENCGEVGGGAASGKMK